MVDTPEDDETAAGVPVAGGEGGGGGGDGGLPWGDAPDGGPEPPPVNPNTDERFTFGELAGCRVDRISITGQHHRVEATYANVVEILDQSNVWGGTFAYDEFKQRIMVMRRLPEEPGPRGNYKPRAFIDDDELTVRLWLSNNLFMRKLAKGDVYDAISKVAKLNSFDPLMDYLNGLQWDGVPRIDSLFATYFGAEGPKQGEDASDLTPLARYNRTISRKFLLTMVARGLDPGCKMDNVAVFEGMQGVGKSTALRVLAGKEWFSDSLSMELDSKDSLLALAGKWVVEMPELSSLRRSEKESVKAFVSRQEDDYRPPYGRTPILVKRRCIIAGTTNSGTYLKDNTGNRRFWPVACGKVDTVALGRDRDQLFAEAVVAYKKGETWYLEGDDVLQAEGQTEDRYEVDPWEGAIFGYLTTPNEDEARAGVEFVARTEVTMAELIHDCFGLQPKDLKGTEFTRVADALRRLGWSKVRTKSGLKREKPVTVLGGAMTVSSAIYQPNDVVVWRKLVAERAA